MPFAVDLDAGTTLLAGLRWQVAPGGMGRTEARTRARGGGEQLFILRADDKSLGSAAAPAGVANWREKRLIAFVSALADAGPTDAWCGVFQLGARFVFVAIANGRIVQPDGDRVFEREEDARARLDAELPLVSTAYAPAPWGIPGTLDGEEFAGSIDWQTVAAMEPIGAKGGAPRAALLLGVAAALVAIPLSWHHWRATQSEIAAQHVVLPPSAPPKPWAGRMKSSPAVISCLTIRDRMDDLSRLGWGLDKVSCDFKLRTYDASFTSFTPDNILPELGPSTVVKLNKHADGITVHGALPPVQPIDRAGETPDPRVILYTRRIIIAAAGKVTWDIDGKRSSFNFELPANLQDAAVIFDAVPTLSLNRLDFSGGTWYVDGELFG